MLFFLYALSNSATTLLFILMYLLNTYMRRRMCLLFISLCLQYSYDIYLTYIYIRLFILSIHVHLYAPSCLSVHIYIANMYVYIVYSLSLSLARHSVLYRVLLNQFIIFRL